MRGTATRRHHGSGGRAWQGMQSTSIAACTSSGLACSSVRTRAVCTGLLINSGRGAGGGAPALPALPALLPLLPPCCAAAASSQLQRSVTFLKNHSRASRQRLESSAVAPSKLHRQRGPKWRQGWATGSHGQAWGRRDGCSCTDRSRADSDVAACQTVQGGQHALAGLGRVAAPGAGTGAPRPAPRSGRGPTPGLKKNKNKNSSQDPTHV